VVVELAPAARRRSPVVLARASAHVGAAGRVTLRLRITARGRQRLRRGAPVAVTLRASVTPDAGRVASRVLRFTLRPTR
jgi:hypothetical protein